MALNTINQRISFDGVQGIIAQLTEMGSAGERAIRRINAAATSGSLDNFKVAVAGASRQIEHQKTLIQEFDGAIGPALSRLNRFSHAFGELRGVIGALAPEMKAFAEIGIGAGFLLAAKSAGEATQNLVNRAAELGTTTEKLEGIGYAAAGVGMSADAADKAFSRLAARIGDTQRNAEKTQDTLNLKAREYDLLQTKNTESIAKYKDELSKLQRQQAQAGEATGRLATGIDRTNLALDKQAASTYAAKNAADKLAAAGGNLGAIGQLKAQDVALKEHIGVENQVDAQQHRNNTTNEAAISISERMKYLQQNITNAQTEGSIALEKSRIALEGNKDEIIRLGVAVLDANGHARDFVDIAGDISDKLIAMKTAQERAAVELKIFGRGWADTAPLMMLGSKGIYEASEAFKQMALTQDEITKGTAFNSAWNKMLYTLAAVKNSVGDLIGTAITPLIDMVREFLMGNIGAMRDFSNSFSKVALPAVELLIGGFKALGVVLAFIKLGFEGVARAINDVFGTKITGSDLIVGFLAFEIALRTILPLWAAFKWAAVFLEIQKVGTIFVFLASKIMLAGQAVMAFWAEFSSGSIILALSAVGPAGWLVLGLAAISAAVITATGGWHHFFKVMSEGLTNIKALAEVTWKILKEVAELAGVSNADVPAAADGQAAYPDASSDGAATVAANRAYEAAHPPGQALGGWIPGSGSGDHVPILAEPGEFMVRKSIASRVGGFLSALNAGLVGGFSMGGIVDRMNSVVPATASASPAPAAHPANDRALFHLTIGDKTFNNLSAPKDTADEMLQYARTSDILSMGKRQGFVGS